MAKVILGIENIDNHLNLFQGKCVGLITNPTGTDSQFKSTIDILNEKTNLTRLFSPEHGIRGDIQDGKEIAKSIDKKSGLTTYSLYGPKGGLAPTSKMLENVDILTFDIQDVGARFYTYISTMVRSMEVCAELDKEFLVFDRPNPIGGNIVEGNILNPNFESFIGVKPITIRHGLTVGELANFVNIEFKIGCNLSVIPMSNWKREMIWQDTGLPWIIPSPNMPTPEAALLYCGTCLFEGTNVSEGRGTTKPFEFIGAPWIDPFELAETLEGYNLPGISFRPTYFSPQFSKYKGEQCGGIDISITDKHSILAVKTGLAILYSIKELYKEFKYREPVREGGKWWLDLLSGDNTLRTGNKTFPEILNIWKNDSEKFQKKSIEYFMYK